MNQVEGLVELTEEETMAVHGGILKGIIINAVWDGMKSFVSWASRKAPGGADEGTWEQIGHSQMTA